MIDLARRRSAGLTTVEHVVGDFLTVPAGRRYDVVSCVAALHHVPLVDGLQRLRELTAPGGRLVVIGLARAADARDVALNAASVVAHRVAVARRGYWQHPAPVTDPAQSTHEIRDAAARILPGSRLRSRLYWRYTLEWTAPG
jgi:SAM-dependent methyltransferase